MEPIRVTAPGKKDKHDHVISFQTGPHEDVIVVDSRGLFFAHHLRVCRRTSEGKTNHVGKAITGSQTNLKLS